MKRLRFIKNLEEVIGKIKIRDIEEFKTILPELDFFTMKKSGRNRFFVCPFHLVGPFQKEKTPSFCYCENRGFFYCFGCGCCMDVISLYMRLKEKGFYPSVIRLAKFFRIKLEWKNIKIEEAYE